MAETKTASSNNNDPKIKTPFARIIINFIHGVPYYNILWFDDALKNYHIGYGSTHLPFVLKWLRERFEITELKPMTYADHIRRMTDEELCDFILEKRENGTCFNDRCYVNDPHKGCDDCTMEWLKQPYKEDTNTHD